MRGRRSSAEQVWSGCDKDDAGDGARALRGSIEGRLVESMLKALGVC